MGFCKDFHWGVATSSYQIEGAWDEDGRGRSIWDDFSHENGRVFQNHNGDVSCDHYHRYAEDVALMAESGIPAYRFSISWPRIFPEGRGAVNEKGADFYDRLIDELLKQGVDPFATLFHWDYPAALDDLGAWRNPDSPRWFGDYVDFCARRYGDRVHHFFTYNEPQCFLGMGYQTGGHAPGQKLPLRNLVPMCHNAHKGHGLAVQALRASAKNARIGYAPCGEVAVPYTNDPADIEAARRSYFANSPQTGMFSISWWSDPVVLGRYPEDGLRFFERFLPANWQDDMALIRQPLDFYGQNIYYGRMIRARDGGSEIVPPPPGKAKNSVNWFTTPEVLYWGPRFLYERYRLPIVITENGMANNDTVSLDNKVHDPQRIDFTWRYLRELRRAADEGVDVRGYFHWTFMDNFEWERGYNERIGLVYVDYQTQRRIPKDSLAWYGEVIRTNGENL